MVFLPLFSGSGPLQQWSLDAPVRLGDADSITPSKAELDTILQSIQQFGKVQGRPC
jgi:hypothetical protein